VYYFEGIVTELPNSCSSPLSPLIGDAMKASKFKPMYRCRQKLLRYFGVSKVVCIWQYLLYGVMGGSANCQVTISSSYWELELVPPRWSDTREIFTLLRIPSISPTSQAPSFFFRPASRGKRGDDQTRYTIRRAHNIN
jgi:hypothetical protein